MNGKKWFMVISDSASTREVFPTLEHANAVATAKGFEYPSLAPFYVVTLVELQAEPAKAAA
jgi:hypothetical protein